MLRVVKWSSGLKNEGLGPNANQQVNYRLDWSSVVRAETLTTERVKIRMIHGDL